MSFTLHQTSKGFTLVEVLVIAPIVILAISAFVGISIALVSDVIVTRNSASQAYNVTSALDLIEQDVRLSTEFPVTTGALPSPQGKNATFTGTGAFTSTDENTLILTTAATDRNPNDSSRRLLYYANQPNLCTSTNISNNPNIIYNRLFTVTNIYFVKNNSLWKRTYVPEYNTDISSPNQNTLCTSSSLTPWPRNTCSPGYTASRCQTQDTKLVDNVTSFTTAFFATGNSTTNVGPGNAQTATTVDVSITAATKATGEDISTTMTRRMSKLNQASAVEAGSLQPATLSLQNGWYPYANDSPGWSTPQYYKTSGCVVMLKGLIKGGSTTVGSTIATLPTGYRPTETLIIATSTRSTSGTSEPGRIYITSDGHIQYYAGTSNWISLDGISFLANDTNCPTTYTFYNDSDLKNGWTNYDTARRLRSAVDNQGRVHLRGLLKQGTYITGAVIASLPSSISPGTYYYLKGVAPNQQFIYYGISGGGSMTARGISSSFLSVQSMYYPGTFGGWTPWQTSGTGDNILKNGWTNYSTSGYPTAAYTKGSDGIVMVKGLIKSGTTTQNTVIATLPAGYRPKERQIFHVADSAGYARVDILTNGNIVVNQVGSNTWLSINDIRFVAGQ